MTVKPKPTVTSTVSKKDRSNYLFDARVINSQRWLILLLGLDSQKGSTIYWAKYYCVKICSLLDMCVFILDDQPNHCSNAEIGKFHCRNATGYRNSQHSMNQPKGMTHIGIIKSKLFVRFRPMFVSRWKQLPAEGVLLWFRVLRSAVPEDLSHEHQSKHVFMVPITYVTSHCSVTRNYASLRGQKDNSSLLYFLHPRELHKSVSTRTFKRTSYLGT